MPWTAIDRTGQRFGRLVVVARSTARADDPPGTVRWLCRCDCGKETIVKAAPLADGRTKSCGCLHRDTTRARSRTHGATVGKNPTREYRSWQNAKRRCYEPAATQFSMYGGRGIRVCDRWRNDFAAFLADMGPCPPDRTLDRIDGNGHYEPGNCRWATLTEQNANRRPPTFKNQQAPRFVIDGKVVTLKALAREAGVAYESLHHRVTKQGQDPFAAIAEMQPRKGSRTNAAKPPVHS